MNSSVTPSEDASNSTGTFKTSSASPEMSSADVPISDLSTAETKLDNHDPQTYQDISPFNPATYKCTGYREDEPYEYFDGEPGKDFRFTIDLEGGSTDHLRDVRPYLYYVGFWSVPETPYQPDFEKLEPAMVEDEYVRRGREYLMAERANKRGYFLVARDWASCNYGIYRRFPFGYTMRSDPPYDDDQGFQENHDTTEYDDDCCGMVVKTNIRTSLPKKGTVRVSPEDAEWDLFIQWFYAPDIHGAMSLLEGTPAHELERHRYKEGRLDDWMVYKELY